MNNTLLKTIITSTALSLGLVFVHQAAAGPETDRAIPARALETQSVSISYAENDLASEDGRAILLSKIKRAAKEVCGPTGAREAGSLSIASRNRSCYESAMAAAVSQVEASQVASLTN